VDWIGNSDVGTRCTSDIRSETLVRMGSVTYLDQPVVEWQPPKGGESGGHCATLIQVLIDQSVGSECALAGAIRRRRLPRSPRRAGGRMSRPWRHRVG
jgi:hypothetical protein